MQSAKKQSLPFGKKIRENSLEWDLVLHKCVDFTQFSPKFKIHFWQKKLREISLRISIPHYSPPPLVSKRKKGWLRSRGLSSCTTIGGRGQRETSQF